MYEGSAAPLGCTGSVVLQIYELLNEFKRSAAGGQVAEPRYGTTAASVARAPASMFGIA